MMKDDTGAIQCRVHMYSYMYEYNACKPLQVQIL